MKNPMVSVQKQMISLYSTSPKHWLREEVECTARWTVPWLRGKTNDICENIMVAYSNDAMVG